MSTGAVLLGPLLFLRSRHAVAAGVLGLLVATLASTMPKELTEVPLRSDVYAPIYLVAIPFAGALCHLCLRRPTATLERRQGRLRVMRALWWPMVIVILALSAAGPLGWTNQGAVACVRNVLMLSGLTTVVGLKVPAVWCWLPAGAFAAGCLTLGINEVTLEPLAWALPLHPPTSVAAWVIALTLAVTAWWGYAERDMAPPH